MKPKDLKSPFRWIDRRPHLQERVLFVPHYYVGHERWTFPGWEHPDIFGREAPTYVEFCSGNGDWVVQKALENPDVNWIAVEKRFDRVRKIWSKMHNSSVKNLWIVCGEAWTFSHYYLPSRCIARVYVNFPDPWPKGKHAKHRLFQTPFVEELARVAEGGAQAWVVTDDLLWALQIAQKMQEAGLWKAMLGPPHYDTQHTGYGESFFDRLWRERGCQIHYLPFVRGP